MKYTIKTTILGLMAVAAISFSACRFNCVKGRGNVTSEDRKVADFSKIKVSGSYKIVLKQDSSLSLHITAEENLLQHIRAEVSGDELKIYSKKSLCPNENMTIIIGVKKLEDIRSSGANSFTSEGKLTLGDLHIKSSGAGEIDLDLNANNVTTEGSGSTEINLKGQASTHRVDVSGNGELNAIDFVVGTYDIKATGAFDATINVLKELNSKTTGSAEIKYRGNPTTVNTKKTGASEVKKID